MKLADFLLVWGILLREWNVQELKSMWRFRMANLRLFRFCANSSLAFIRVSFRARRYHFVGFEFVSLRKHTQIKSNGKQMSFLVYTSMQKSLTIFCYFHTRSTQNHQKHVFWNIDLLKTVTYWVLLFMKKHALDFPCFFGKKKNVFFWTPLGARLACLFRRPPTMMVRKCLGLWRRTGPRNRTSLLSKRKNSLALVDLNRCLWMMFLYVLALSCLYRGSKMVGVELEWFFVWPAKYEPLW